jgi:hypothetical protein
MSEWISVEDRLPDLNNDRYLICIRFPNGTKCVREALWHYGKFLGESLESVTHWQPLPEPPE